MSTVQKQINKLPNTIQARVIETLLSLKETPRPSNSLNDYRVLYDIDDKTQTMTLRRVARRRDIYREQ